MQRCPAYVLTTPVRNEWPILPGLVESVAGFQPRPALWLIVDDSSTDGSREWLREAAQANEWMVVVPAPEISDEYLGGHVARLKRFGLATVLSMACERGHDPEFAGVLDADITAPPDHYARLMEAFNANPRLGIVSSLIQVDGPNGPETESFQREDLPRGGTQFFRRTCLEDIGGLPPYPGFDGASNVKARARGWHTRLVADVVAVQSRPTSARYGHSAGFARKGEYAWFLGMHPILILLRALVYTAREPHSAGLHFLKGWCGSAWRRAPRCPDPEVRRGYGARRVREVLSAQFHRGPRYVKR